MFKIFDWLYKIITLPLTLLSLPFKIIDWIFKIFGLLVMTMVVYYFGWFPALNSFVDTLIPGFGPFVTALKRALGLANEAKKALPIEQITESETFRQARDLLR
jgi:hypothetical protein